MTRINAIAGRLLLAYPLHVICGALTGTQLVRRKYAGLRWWWVLLPAVLTHGFYDSALFTIGTIGAGQGSNPDPQSDYTTNLHQLQLQLVSFTFYINFRNFF